MDEQTLIINWARVDGRLTHMETWLQQIETTLLISQAMLSESLVIQRTLLNLLAPLRLDPALARPSQLTPDAVQTLLEQHGAQLRAELELIPPPPPPADENQSIPPNPN